MKARKGRTGSKIQDSVLTGDTTDATFAGSYRTHVRKCHVNAIPAISTQV